MAELGLSSGMQDLSVVIYGLLATACGIQFPEQGLNPGPLHWECGVLVTGRAGKSPENIYLNVKITELGRMTNPWAVRVTILKDTDELI